MKLDTSKLWAPAVQPAAAPCCKTVQEADTACEVCGGTDDTEGDEIVLCDGSRCGAAYHQKYARTPRPPGWHRP